MASKEQPKDLRSAVTYYSGNLHEPIKAARIRVKIWGIDSTGRTFCETVQTRYVGREQAGVEGVKANLKVGDVIGASNGELKSRFRVEAVKTKASGEHSLELLMVAPPRGNFWGIKLDALPRLLRGSERRSSPRFRCSGFAVIQVLGQKFVVRAPISDIALNGCYIELAMPYAVGCTFKLEVTVRDTYMECPAQVVSSHPGVGMGVRFDPERLTGKRGLRLLLDELDRELFVKQPL
jgi:hypothetical protein